MSDGEATAVESSSSPAETEKEAPGEWSDRGIDRSQTVVTENAAETNAISSMVATLQSGPSLTVVMGILVLAILGTVTWLVLEDGGGEGVTAPEHSERVAEPTKSPEEAAMDSPEPEGKESTAGNAEESEWTRTVRIESKPVSLVFERGAGNKSGMRELGETPFDFVFTHPTEARRLLFRPKESEDRKIYTEMESTIFAADYEEPSGEEGFPAFCEAEMRGPYGPGCNDYLERFNRAFEEVE